MSAQPPCVECGVLTWWQHHGPAPAGMVRRAGRGLCQRCFARALRSGTLSDFECRNRSGDEVLAEWNILRRQGHTKRQAADRLGMTLAAFDRAYHRARAAGDPRARPAIGNDRRSASA